MGQSLRQARDWARKMTGATRVPMVSNHGRMFGYHTVTDDEREKWAEIMAELNARLGEKVEPLKRTPPEPEASVTDGDFIPDEPFPGTFDGAT